VIVMREVDQFLEAAVRLERDSALRYDELADAITGQGPRDVIAFFRQQAIFSRRHLQTAESRIGNPEPWDGVMEDEEADPAAVTFPSGESPEAADIWAADGQITVEDAMAVALEAEERGRVYYATVAQSTKDPEVKILAEAFAKEESEHVQALKDLIARLKKA
jgi:rubrerythrin